MLSLSFSLLMFIKMAVVFLVILSIGRVLSPFTVVVLVPAFGFMVVFVPVLVPIRLVTCSSVIVPSSIRILLFGLFISFSFATGCA